MKINKFEKIVNLSLIIILIINTLFGLFLPTATRADIAGWPFTDAGNYTVSDGDKIEISDGVAKLKRIYTPGTNWIATDAGSDTDWSYRQTIIVDSDKVSGSNDLTNFPILVSLTDNNLRDTGHGGYVAQTDGGDIVFTNSAHTILDHEIESYTETSGELIAWVDVDTLKYNEDTTIYLYYGNADCADQEDINGTWDSNFHLVTHLNQDPVAIDGQEYGITDAIKDSSGNGHHGTSHGTMISDDLVDGQVGKGIDFDGSNDCIIIGAIPVTYPFTFSTWIESDMINNSRRIISSYDLIDGHECWMIELQSATKQLVIWDGSAWIKLIDDGTLIANQKYYITITVNSSLQAQASVNSTFFTATATGASTWDVPSLALGSKYYIHGHNYDGTMDEVRISNIVRSAGWIATEFNNQDSPATFYDVGIKTDLETLPSSKPTVVNNIGQDYVSLSSFSESMGVGNVGNVNYQISNNGTNWKYWNGTNWSAAGSADFNSATVINTNISQFVTDVGAGTFYFKAFLTSDGSQQVKLSAVSLGYVDNQAPTAPDNLLTNSLSNPVNVVTLEPVFSAVYNDPDVGDIANKYRIEVNTSSAFDGTVRWDSGADGTAIANCVAGDRCADIIYTGDSLSLDGTTYYWRIKFWDDDGLSGVWSTESASFTIQQVPTDPTNCSAARDSDTQFTVTWTDNALYEDNFKIERQDDQLGSWSEIASVSSSATSTVTFIDNEVNNPSNFPAGDHNYQYRVRAMNTAGYSDYATDSVIHYTTPGIPQSLIANYLSDSEFSCSFTRNAQVEATHHLWRCSNSECDSNNYLTDLGTTEVNTTSTLGTLTDNTLLTADSKYRWRVRAESPDSPVLPSDWTYSNYEYTTSAPPTIGDLTYISDSEITVIWTDNSSYEDGFRLEVSIDGGDWEEITAGSNTVSANVQSYSYNTALTNHRYRFRARAHQTDTEQNEQLFSIYSDNSSTIYTTPSAPTISTPVANSNTAITWYWTDNSIYEDSFRLDFVTGAGTDVDNIPANSTSTQTIGLAVNTPYTVHLHSYRSDRGESITSSNCLPIYTLANSPVNLTFTNLTSESVKLNWLANGNPDGTEYLVTNLTKGTNSGWITTLFYSVDSLSPGINYSFSVKARNGNQIVTDVISGAQTILGWGRRSPQIPVVDSSSLTINQDDLYTTQREITLNLSAQRVRLILVGEQSDLSDGDWRDYATSLPYTLSVGDGPKTIYLRFSSADGNLSPIISSSIILDTTPPVTPTIIYPQDEVTLSQQQITIYGQAEVNTQVALRIDQDNYYLIEVDQQGNWQQVVTLPSGVHYLEVKVQDLAGLISENRSISFNIIPPVEEIIPTEEIILKEPIEIIPVVPLPEELALLEEISEKEIIPLVAEEIISPERFEAKKFNLIIAPLVKLLKLFLPLKPKQELEIKPIEQVVTDIPPLALSNQWNLLPSESINQFVLAPLPREIRVLAQKFSELGKTLEKVGITKLTDVAKLKTAKLTLPGLTETLGLPTVKVEAGRFVLPQSVPIAQMSTAIKQKIPSEIVFTKTGGELIDFNIALSVTEKNKPEQKITTIVSKPLQLMVKPDQPVKSVKGYVVFKSKKTQSTSLQFPFNSLVGSLVFANPTFAHLQKNPVRVEERLVLLEFEYTDPDGDGIYTAEIQAPVVEGTYEIITVMDYKDEKLGKKEIRLTTVVDPEGYIYATMPAGKLRIAGAIVSIYWLCPKTKQYELWSAKEYQQENPQITDDTGKYSFLVPPGTYYLRVEHPNYPIYQSKTFVVKEGSGIHMNIELKTKYWWLKIIDWKVIIMIIFGALLLYNFYRDKMRDKRK